MNFEKKTSLVHFLSSKFKIILNNCIVENLLLLLLPFLYLSRDANVKFLLIKKITADAHFIN